MIINKSKRTFLKLFKQYIDINLDPLNTYMFNSRPESFTLLYEFNTSLVKTGYESFGFLKYDKYLTNHRLFVSKKDFIKYTAYVFDVPHELVPSYYKIIDGDFNALYNTEKVLVDKECIINLNNYRKYETI